ncbi:unnamed protein product, partial [Vitis vinifera]
MNCHVVLISDRNPSFLSATNKVFGSGYNAHCLSRLKESLDYFISSNLVSERICSGHGVVWKHL